jgi:hypothetical protein
MGRDGMECSSVRHLSSAVREAWLLGGGEEAGPDGGVGTENPFMNTPDELVGFYPSPHRQRSRHAPVAQGIEQRPPEPCAQVRILPGAPWMRCLKTP